MAKAQKTEIKNEGKKDLITFAANAQTVSIHFTDADNVNQTKNLAYGETFQIVNTPQNRQLIDLLVKQNSLYLKDV